MNNIESTDVLRARPEYNLFDSNDSVLMMDRKISKVAKARFQTHHWQVTSHIYSFGRLCTKPLINLVYSIQVALKGMGGQGRKKALALSFMWLPVNALAIPLLLLGAAIRITLGRCRLNNAVSIIDYTKNPEIPSVDRNVGENDRLHGFSYNIAGLFRNSANDVLPHEERAKQLLKHFSNLSKPKTPFEEYAIEQNLITEEDFKRNNLPLFIGFQEAFNIDSSKILAEGLKEEYPFVIHSVGHSAKLGLGVNSGLQFHSRVPIKGCEFREFTNPYGGDIMSNKGVLKVELDLGDRKTSLVYLTHTQSETDEIPRSRREEQLQSIAIWMEEDKQEDLKNGITRHSRILMGDLNDGNTDEKTKNNKGEPALTGPGSLNSPASDSDSDSDIPTRIGEHNYLMSPLGALKDFHDPYLDDHHSITGERKTGVYFNSTRNGVEPNGTWFAGIDSGGKGWGSDTVAGCNLDHMLLLDQNPSLAAHVQTNRIKKAEGDPSENSDHLPVEIRIATKNAAKLDELFQNLHNLLDDLHADPEELFLTRETTRDLHCLFKDIVELKRVQDLSSIEDPIDFLTQRYADICSSLSNPSDSG